MAKLKKYNSAKYNDDFARDIEKRFDYMGYTTKHKSAALDMSKPTYLRKIKDPDRFTFGELKTLARLFGVTPWELIDDKHFIENLIKNQA